MPLHATPIEVNHNAVLANPRAAPAVVNLMERRPIINVTTRHTPDRDDMHSTTPDGDFRPTRFGAGHHHFPLLFGFAGGLKAFGFGGRWFGDPEASLHCCNARRPASPYDLALPNRARSGAWSPYELSSRDGVFRLPAMSFSEKEKRLSEVHLHVHHPTAPLIALRDATVIRRRNLTPRATKRRIARLRRLNRPIAKVGAKRCL